MLCHESLTDTEICLEARVKMSLMQQMESISQMDHFNELETP